jgi:hypothetical protein
VTLVKEWELQHLLLTGLLHPFCHLRLLKNGELIKLEKSNHLQEILELDTSFLPLTMPPNG